jgi:hypothetical protein
MLPDITINLNGFLHSYVLVSHFLVRIINLIMYATLPESRSLPSVTLGKEHSANISSAKGYLPSSFFRTLGKNFAECQKALGKLRIEKIKKKQQNIF